MTNTKPREQNSHHLDWGIKAPPGRVHAPVAESEALIEPFLRRCKDQENMYVAAGFPLEGITDFWSTWFAAWNEDSPEALEECWTHDLVWTISSTGQLEYHGRDATVDLARFGYLFARELGFYPWDGTDTHLPYYDFLDGQVRAAFPYSGATRTFWHNAIPWPRKPIRGCGVDRYLLRKEGNRWRIARIDTDQDVSAPFLQLLSFADATTRVMAWLIRTLPAAGRKLGLYDRESLYSPEYIASRRARNLPLRTGSVTVSADKSAPPS
ncbi:nuclear transport factor 2 family protein [Mycobacteroides abscessus]|uniref:nuclear transport factor 2 family protein n=1 Tax=Mycobacteroides abscessus TaxID=36809 RepID=UPI000E6A195E|nr:nuclear transport factor 2 family protein [Mycobacteroides abscessus]RIT24335.1 nuclear transport factor 2 family protein [Mycobacteroides abscessus]